MGFCNGIENYSLHFGAGSPATARLPDRLLPQGLLLIVDESHATVPQIGGCTTGTARESRPWSTSASGCRRPWTTGPRAWRSSTGSPARPSSSRPPRREYELKRSNVVAEQLIRPTGLLDPEIVIRPTKGQVEDLIGEIKAAAAAGERVLRHDPDQAPLRGPHGLPARGQDPGASTFTPTSTPSSALRSCATCGSATSTP